MGNCTNSLMDHDHGLVNVSQKGFFFFLKQKNIFDNHN